MRIEQAKAKERMEEGRNQYSPSENSHEGSRSDEATAEQFGISSNTMRREVIANKVSGPLCREPPEAMQLRSKESRSKYNALFCIS